MKILESNKTIEKLILDEFSKKLWRATGRAGVRIVEFIKKEFKEDMIKSPEYQSLTADMYDSLKAHFGIPNPEEKCQAIINTWINGITYKSRKPQRMASVIESGLRIYLYQMDYSDVLALPQAIQITERGISPSPLPWLNWLLLDGSKQRLVKEYKIKASSRGRTGLAVMEGPSANYNWGLDQIPQHLQGTENNNWVTRSFDRINPQIIQMFEIELKKELK